MERIKSEKGDIYIKRQPFLNEIVLRDGHSVGHILFEAAWEIWRRCFENESTALSDFCVQGVSQVGAIFGSYNRLQWRPLTGWSADPSLCTPDFLERFGVLRQQDGFSTLREVQL